MSSNKLFLLVICLFLFALLLVGCGAPAADDVVVDDDPDAVDDEVSEPVGDLREITFVLPRTIEVLEDSPWWVAVEMGYFEEEGIVFNAEQAFGITDARMVAAGQAEFAVPSPGYIVMSIETGLPIKAVLQYDAINIFGMAVLNDSDIQTWEDMEGKSVALGDAAWEVIITPTLVAAGVDIETIDWVVAGEARAQLVQEGEIDILFTWVGEVYQFIAQGFDFRYIGGEEVLQVPSNPVITSLDIIENDPELVAGFVRAMQKAMYFTYYNPEAASDIITARFPAIDVGWDGILAITDGRIAQMFGQTPEQQEFFLERIAWAHEDRWQTYVDYAVLTGILENPLPLDQIYTNEFLDFSWDRAEVEQDADSYEFVHFTDQQ